LLAGDAEAIARGKKTPESRAFVPVYWPVSAYDKTKIGWKVEVLQQVPKGLSAPKRRKIYDTRQPGRGNGSPTFGDNLTEEERWAGIEFLKTL
jgi:hypothetical protein